MVADAFNTGSQAKNGPLMRLLATVLQMPIIIPPQPSAAVVLGAAMLGRFAHDLSTSREGKPITTQCDAKEAMKVGDRLWDVMVEMTQPGYRIEPRTGTDGRREKKLLDVKYKIFRESIDVQRRWRGMVAEAITP
jgi:ribulose kinase